MTHPKVFEVALFAETPLIIGSCVLSFQCIMVKVRCESREYQVTEWWVIVLCFSFGVKEEARQRLTAHSPMISGCGHEAVARCGELARS